MLGLPPLWMELAFTVVIGAGLLALFAWGIAVQRLVVRLERRHPAWFETLRARSRRRARRLAAGAELQGVLFRGDPIPEDVLADPVAARLIALERRLRGLFVPLALTGFLIFALA